MAVDMSMTTGIPPSGIDAMERFALIGLSDSVLADTSTSTGVKG
jgi:hypothetical protein